MRVSDLEARVDCREEVRPVLASADLSCRRHAVFIEPHRGLFRRVTTDSPIERAAERVDVGPGSLQAPVRRILLVGGVARLDDAGEHLAHLGDGTPGRSKIEQHRRTVGTHDDVVGGYVTMQEIGRVQSLQRIEQRRNDPVQLLLCG